MARLAAALAAALLFALPIEASANHIAGATYNGAWGYFDFSGVIDPHQPHGAMSFTVTPDGAGISSFGIEGPFPCRSPIQKNYAPPLPITNHAFTDNSSTADSTFSLSGSFPATFPGADAQSASGTSRIEVIYLFYPYMCDSYVWEWRATTTASPPPPDPDPEPDPEPDPDPDPEPDPQPDPQPEPQPEPDELPDTVAPALVLAGKLVQKLGKTVAVGVRCRSEACVATARGFVDVPRTGVARRLKLRRARTNLAQGDKKRLKLRMPRKTRRAARRALKRGKKVKAKVRVVARDAAGNRTVRRRTIRLRR